LKHVFAVDFDGVICDSAAETGVTAWRAGSRLFPSWNTTEPAAEYLNRFIRLRPVLETGYQAIVLMYLIKKGVDDHTISTQFQALCESFIGEENTSVSRLIQLFGDTRDQWIKSGMEDWLSRNRFYDGIIERLEKASRRETVYILTTKQERFARALLQYGKVETSTMEIFGLDRKKSKEEILIELMKRHDPAFNTFHFYEDRLKTLVRIADHPGLSSVRLYLATWGYITETDRKSAEASTRIICIGKEDFLKI